MIPTTADTRPLHCVAVIGAGERGRAFALRCAAAGLSVVLQDVLWSKLRKVEEQLAAVPDPVRAQIGLATTIEDAVRDADIAIDFVPDELESKLEIFSLLDRMAPPKTIFCTPTQLSISDLASCTYRADRCVALAGSDGEAGSDVRLTLGARTDPATGDAVTSWLRQIGFRVACVAETAVSL